MVTAMSSESRVASSRSDASRLVVDSSVAFKWIESDREHHVADARALLESHLEGSVVLAAPSHLLLEVLNAARARGAGESHMERLARSLIDVQLELHELAGLAADAALLATRHDLTLYDAAFAALARELGAELVTADRRLAASGACQIRLLGHTGSSLE